MTVALPDAGVVSRRRLESFMAAGGMVWTLVGVLMLIAAIVSPDFRTVANLSNISRQAVVLSIVALGQFLVVLTGGVDLSLGMIVRLTALATAITIDGHDDRTLSGIAVALLIGLAAGMVNGIIVTWLRVAAFVATLGTLAVLQGISLVVASTPRGQTSESLSSFWAWTIGDLYGVVVVTGLVWLVVGGALNRTVWGRHVVAIGGDPRVATASGVRTSWVRLSIYALAGVLAAAGGILTAARAGVGDPNAGFGLEFESLAAVVIGGASLAGGRGRLLGALGGVILLSMIGNVFNLLDIDVWYQQLLKGGIILVGAAAYVTGRQPARRGGETITSAPAVGP
jgi:ribose transport system permease protein